MGGYVTFAVWRREPERIRALVLADTRAEADTDEGRRNREAMLAALAASGPAAVADAMMPKMVGPSTWRERRSVADWVREIILRSDPAAIGDAIRCLMDRPDSTPLLSSMAVPVLLVAGRDDELTPVALHERMLSAMPHASLTVIEGAGHLSSLEQPEVFNRTLWRFLRSLS
jgi:3-oxoadipate enol-lactonase